jgi:hypothetical protein
MDFDRLAPGFALAGIDLAQAEHLTVYYTAIGKTPVLHDTPVVVRLAVLQASIAAQEHAPRLRNHRLVAKDQGLHYKRSPSTAPYASITCAGDPPQNPCFQPPVEKHGLAQCGLQMHPDKTKIVYRKDGKRKGKYPNRQFDFLGYTFRPRLVKNSKRNSLFVSFTPAVSNQALKAMRETRRKLNYRNRTDLRLALATSASPATTATRLGYSRVLTIWPTQSHGTD